jgi:type IV pilus assembly protein PilC
MPALVFMGLMLFPIGYVVGTILGVFIDPFGFKVGAPEWFLGTCAMWGAVVAAALAAFLAYRLKTPVLDDMVVNMVDVGEETGELDTMLYKVSDVFDEEVAVLTESLTALMEPLLIITLGGIVGFIVIALFMPLISLISNLSGGK